MAVVKKIDLKAKAAEPLPPASEPPELPLEIEPEPPRERLFDDPEEDEAAILTVVPDGPIDGRPDDGIPPLDSDLTQEQRDVFVSMVNQALPIKERALLLAKLAHMTDTKRAPVALRAIQEVNALTKMSGTQSVTAPPMFQLPPGTKVSVEVKKVRK